MAARLPVRLLTAVLACCTAAAQAGTLTVSFTDSAGKPLTDAVAMLDTAGARPAVKPMADAEISQAKRAFNPRVTVITVGTKVNFPNFDTVRHHVYSFSAARTFELKLYAGVPTQPVLFDKPGVAVLGCNIHDRMAAWVLVSDTPWFARSGDDGRARIEGLSAGSWRLRVWHAGLPPGSEPAPVTLTLPAGDLNHEARLAVVSEP